MSPRLIAERIGCLAALPLLAAAIYSTVRLAAADAAFRANTTESLASAVRLESGDADYHELFADHLEADGRNSDPDREIAARLSPFESKYWIGLGIRAEVTGDQARAEKMYLHAAEVDRMFVPRWTLMNFYFRRQDQAKFWVWAKRAFEMGFGDQTAAFRLCWLMTDDPRVVEQVLPSGKEIRREYLDFLIDTRRFHDLSPVDREFAEAADASDAPSLLYYCERTLIGNPRSSLDVWNTLCRKGLEPFSAISLRKGSVVTDGDFHIPPIERAFDWRIPIVDGAQVATLESGPGLGIQLNGDQPEDCVILLQYIPLSPGRDYRMSYEYSSTTAAPNSGLTWEIVDPVSNMPVARTNDLRLTGDAVSDQTTFTAGESGSGRLTLHYKREPGTVRHEESLLLRRIAIEPQGQAAQ